MRCSARPRPVSCLLSCRARCLGGALWTGQAPERALELLTPLVDFVAHIHNPEGAGPPVLESFGASSFGRAGRGGGRPLRGEGEGEGKAAAADAADAEPPTWQLIQDTLRSHGD